MPKNFVFYLPKKDLTAYRLNGTDVVLEGGGIFGLSSSSALLRSTPTVMDTLGSFREKTGGSSS